ncbi:hypothetical protein J4219_06515 [Candidatus Woesearchaeota archaeon]|nr:hypothetical protein [Candidatus Woesearchaeota archaeon]
MSSFLVSNLNGSFALFGLDSRYSGVFFHDKGRMFKTITGFSSNSKKGTSELWRIVRESDSFWFARRLPVFFYECASAVDVFFDCKQNFDNRVWGRHYDWSFEGDTLVLRFEKRNDARESAGEEYSFYLASHGCRFELLNKWEECDYSFDKLRGSPPYERYVLRGCKAFGSFCSAFSTDRESAVKLAREGWSAKERLADEMIKIAQIHHDDVALHSAQYSLKVLHQGHGLFAGLPWFHQHWARDELICVTALWESDERVLAKVILFSHLSKILPKGKLAGTFTRTIADSGWLFLQIENIVDDLSDAERVYVKDRLSYYLSEVKKCLVNGLVVNDAKETWMDSIDRSGARIEIQALTLAACRLARTLGIPVDWEESLKQRVREEFHKAGVLIDGVSDYSIRPNVFIAAYACPELLSKKEWVRCFDAILPYLWLSWGGLSTLDTRSKSFVREHSGELAYSYHNGDSWFWINNLAGVVLSRLDYAHFEPYVAQLFKASRRELLSMGAIGHCAELSSAQELKSEGSPVQAWSAAMFIELWLERAKHKKR